LNLVADGTRNTGVRVLKEINRFKPNDCNAIASFYGVSGKKYNIIQRFLSDLKSGSKTHAKEWLIFPENIGKRLSIDETSSNGELYTFNQ
jgi:hypothetical protein